MQTIVISFPEWVIQLSLGILFAVVGLGSGILFVGFTLRRIAKALEKMSYDVRVQTKAQDTIANAAEHWHRKDINQPRI